MSESSADFTRIRLWQDAQELAVAVIGVVSKMQRDRTSDLIANQLIRAAGSVPANIAEGYGRFSQPAYRNHLSIARGSLFEVTSWVDLLHRSKYISTETRDELTAACDNVGRMLTVRMKGLGDAKRSYIREEKATYETD